GLSPKTRYRFRLVLTYRVRERRFAWPQHSHFEFLTSGDVPGAPGRPQVKRVVRDVFQLYWEESPNNGYSDLVYEVEVRSDLEKEWRLFANSSLTTSIVNNFSVNTNYEFRVRALNEYGASGYSYSEKPFLPETGGEIYFVLFPLKFGSCFMI
ncbi:tyrosine-protein kinase receptor, partial [Caerostris darwini]